MKFSLFLKKNCQESDRIKNTLDTIEFEYTAIYLDQNYTMEQFKQIFGKDSEPPMLGAQK
jgi:arsenate reductase-like glutaredoxin family protein